MERKNTRRTGTEKERIAAAYLESRGVQVIERNFRCRQGEIDLVCRDGEYLVFVEVKYRRTAAVGNPLAAVDLRKQRRICRAAKVYCFFHATQCEQSVRYDVVGILGREVVWIQNAFPHREDF